MYLQKLEDYIVELGMMSVDGEGGAFVDVDEVILNLMDILIVEESLIPDFVVSGNSGDGFIEPVDDDEFDMSYFCDDFTYWEENTKKLGDAMLKAISRVSFVLTVALIAYLFGFFTAP